MKQYLPLSRCFKLTIEPNRRDSYHFMQVYIEKKSNNIFDNIRSSFKQTLQNGITFYLYNLNDTLYAVCWNKYEGYNRYNICYYKYSSHKSNFFLSGINQDWIKNVTCNECQGNLPSWQNCYLSSSSSYEKRFLLFGR